MAVARAYRQATTLARPLLDGGEHGVILKLVAAAI
jgi:hypothetical protein